MSDEATELETRWDIVGSDIEPFFRHLEHVV